MHYFSPKNISDFPMESEMNGITPTGWCQRNKLASCLPPQALDILIVTHAIRETKSAQLHQGLFDLKC